MLRQIGVVSAVVTALLFGGAPAYAIGVYADLPIQFTASDCTGKCTFTPSGIKAGVVLPANVGIGAQAWSVSDSGTKIDFTMVDVSYLLPVPVVNIMLGLGGGSMGVESGGQGKTGRATNVWASFGFPILPLFDLHLGYHKVNGAIHDGPIDFTVKGAMYSIGAMFNF